MAKSALEAINGCNLFGEKGASWSVVYVDIDAHNRNRSIFETMLPRESSSKVGSAFAIRIQCHVSHYFHRIFDAYFVGRRCFFNTNIVISRVCIARGTTSGSD